MVTEEPSERLSEVIEMYLEHGDREKRWQPRTKKDVVACLNFLKDFIGDVPIQSISRKTMSDYQKTLMRFPTHTQQKARYRNKTIAQILRMNVDEQSTMAPHTVNKYIDRACALFQYAVIHGRMDKNPAADLQMTTGKRAHENRDAFDKGDLRKLFHSEEYLKDTHNKPFKFWMPILALYTGCRLEELAQLHLEDIRQEHGVWCIDINDSGDKTTKTETSNRLIPLHPFLADDLRFIDYAERVRAKGAKRLFPDLEKRQGRYGTAVSRWFNNTYRKQCGIEDDKKKVFHSFRHTFIDKLSQSLIEMRIDRTVGRAFIQQSIRESENI